MECSDYIEKEYNGKKYLFVSFPLEKTYFLMGEILSGSDGYDVPEAVPLVIKDRKGAVAGFNIKVIDTKDKDLERRIIEGVVKEWSFGIVHPLTINLN